MGDVPHAVCFLGPFLWKEEPGRSQVIKEQLGLNSNYLETSGQKVGVAKHLGLCERNRYIIFGRIYMARVL